MMPPPYLESTLFNVKHHGDFPNTILHREVIKEVSSGHKSPYIIPLIVGMGLTKEQSNTGRIDSLLDKI